MLIFTPTNKTGTLGFPSTAIARHSTPIEGRMTRQAIAVANLTSQQTEKGSLPHG
jgi:hypothetical protein